MTEKEIEKPNERFGFREYLLAISGLLAILILILTGQMEEFDNEDA